MFEQFTKKKTEEYISKLDFIHGRTSLSVLHSSSLPPYILSYLDNSLEHSHLAIESSQLEELIYKAISLNINYLIKPKATLKKFIFGKLETKPADEVFRKIQIFAFYRYYIDLISEFISLNNPLRISSSQVDKLINEINKNIYEEISGTDPESLKQRQNLIQILFYFFIDFLPDNKPINKRLPKAILSAFFYDKGFISIKKNIDNFFKDDIFIQEAIDLMTLKDGVRRKKGSSDDEEDKQILEMIKRAKESNLSQEGINKEVEQTIEVDSLTSEKHIPADIPINPTPVKVSEPEPEHEEETQQEEINEDIRINDFEEKKIILDPDERKEEAIYSDVLMEASEKEEDIDEGNISDDTKQIYKIFFNKRHRLRIIKKLFGRNRSRFEDKVQQILNSRDWGEATFIIDDHFESNNIDFLSTDAIRFLDILQNYFQSNENVNKEP